MDMPAFFAVLGIGVLLGSALTVWIGATWGLREVRRLRGLLKRDLEHSSTGSRVILGGSFTSKSEQGARDAWRRSQASGPAAISFEEWERRRFNPRAKEAL